MFQKTTLILLLLAIVSCKNTESNEKDKIKTADWLLGKWENKTQTVIFLKIGNNLTTALFKRESFFIKEKDTLHFEAITLQQKGEELFYTATVKGQNEDKPVTFKLTSATDKKLVFENPKHDYPQKITYSLIKKDSLVAEISGIQQGKPSSEKFGMKKTE